MTVMTAEHSAEFPCVRLAKRRIHCSYAGVVKLERDDIITFCACRRSAPWPMSPRICLFPVIWETVNVGITSARRFVLIHLDYLYRSSYIGRLLYSGGVRKRCRNVKVRVVWPGFFMSVSRRMMMTLIYVEVSPLVNCCTSTNAYRQSDTQYQ